MIGDALREVVQADAVLLRKIFRVRRQVAQDLEGRGHEFEHPHQSALSMPMSRSQSPRRSCQVVAIGDLFLVLGLRPKPWPPVA